MDQLIAQLETRIKALTAELKSARAEIQQLKQQNTSVLTSAYDILNQQPDLSTSDQLQLYIDDSLDLLVAPETHSLTSHQEGDAANQLSFNLNQSDEVVATTPIDIELLDAEQTLPPENELYSAQPVPSLLENSNILPVEETASLQEEQEQHSETAPLSKAEKKRRKNQKSNRRLIALLEERYPHTFNWNNPKPLKVGIDKEIKLDSELTASKLKRALAAYVRSDRYKKCLVGHTERVDLEGRSVPSTSNKNRSRQKPKKTSASPEKAVKAAQEQRKESPPALNLSPEERMRQKLELLLSSHKHE